MQEPGASILGVMQNVHVDKIAASMHVLDLLDACQQAADQQELALAAAASLLQHCRTGLRMAEQRATNAEAPQLTVICSELSSVSMLVDDSAAQVLDFVRGLLDIVRLSNMVSC
jgi:hypothetical protein